MTAPKITGGSITGVTYSNIVITGGSITGAALSGNTFTNPVISGGSINNTPIGATTATTATFTTATVNRVADSQGGSVAPISSVMRNRIINGAMVINQRATAITATGYSVDRFAYFGSQAAKATISQDTSVFPTGFNASLKVVSSSAYTVGSTEEFEIYQSIEGFNIADLGWGTAAAKTVTLSFQVYSSLTGTFGGAIQNGTGARSYPFSYSIPVANTWTTISITIAGDTSGTWNTTNGIGIAVYFGLGVGSTKSGTVGSWSSSYFTSATGATSVVGTNGATFYITGVQLEVGTQATGFEYRQYQQELALCQRYYIKYLNASGVAFGSSFNDTTTTAVGLVVFPVTMRAAPTALEQTGTASNYRVRRSGGAATDCSSVPVFSTATTNLSQITFTVASGLTAGEGSILQANGADRFLAWSAEL
jgi:hypothetical protein